MKRLYFTPAIVRIVNSFGISGKGRCVADAPDAEANELK